MNNSWRPSLTHSPGCSAEAESSLHLQTSPSPSSKSATRFWFLLDSQLVSYHIWMVICGGIHTQHNPPIPTFQMDCFFFAAEWWRLPAAKDFSQQKEKSSWKDHLGNLYSSLHFARLPTRSPSLMSLSNLFLDWEAQSLRQFSNTSPGRPNLWQVPQSHFSGRFQLFRRRW